MLYNEARKLVDEIKIDLSNLLPKIKKAWESQVWRALEYPSWEALCDTEFSGLRIPLELRREIVPELREAGMSERAIAKTVNVGKTTVRRDLATCSHTEAELVHNGPPDDPSPEQSPRVTGQDGKTYPMNKKPAKLTEEELEKRSLRMSAQADRTMAELEENRKTNLRGLVAVVVDQSLAIAEKELTEAVKHASSIDFNFTEEEWQIRHRRIDKCRKLLDMFGFADTKVDNIDDEFRAMMEE